MDPVANGTTLAHDGLRVAHLFRSLQVTWQQAQPIGDIEYSNFHNEKDRFHLWATSLGLYQQGHASLDYRFRDAAFLQAHTQKLLQDMSLALEQCKLFHRNFAEESKTSRQPC